MDINQALDILNENKLFNKVNFLEKIFDDSIRVSLDIGTCSVKVVQIKKSNKECQLLNVGYKEIESPPESKGEIEDAL